MPFKDRLDPAVIVEDIAVFDAIQAITGYAPENTALTKDALTAKKLEMETKKADETVKEGIAKGARDIANAAEHVFHDLILAAKDQVKAKFGGDSNEWQSLGMKKKSERKKPHRQNFKTPPPTQPSA